MLVDSAADAYNKVRLLAVTAPHSGDWLHARPISACGLRLDNEAIRVAVGLRLGVTLCQPTPANVVLRLTLTATTALAAR